MVVAWHMLSTGHTYQDLRGDSFARPADPDREARRLTRKPSRPGELSRRPR
jgi:hypothetical protein